MRSSIVARSACCKRMRRGRDTRRSASPPATHVASIPACLPEQFCAIRLGPSPGPHHRPAGLAVKRHPRRVVQIGLVETGSRQQAADDLEVAGLAGVTGAHDRQFLVVDDEAGPQHARRLQRLRRATRQHRVVRPARPTARPSRRLGARSRCRSGIPRQTRRVRRPRRRARSGGHALTRRRRTTALTGTNAQPDSLGSKSATSASPSR